MNNRVVKPSPYDPSSGADRVIEAIHNGDLTSVRTLAEEARVSITIGSHEVPLEDIIDHELHGGVDGVQHKKTS